MSVRWYNAGDVILREGAVGDTAYLIERGRVAVTKDLHGQPIVLGLLGVGEIFGEMSLIDEAPRSATVTAMEETVVREIQQEELFQSVHSDPNMVLHLLRRLFARLRDAHIAILQYPFVDRLYGELLERGVRYFFPTNNLRVLGPLPASRPRSLAAAPPEAVLELEWGGGRYALTTPGQPFTAHEARLLQSIGAVLSMRYQLLFTTDLAAQSFHLFQGILEDRYVSAFLEPALYQSVEALAHLPDRVAAAIEVLRVSALTTYENRPITTGVLLVGPSPDPYHALVPSPPDALPYASALTAIHSFHRLCDALQTVALVNAEGRLSAIIDIQDWAQPLASRPLPVPSASRYQAHSRATLCSGHLCLILTPHGEIKVFADGVQVFNFLHGRWHLTDAVAKYQRWQQALGDVPLAERLFTAAVNLAEDRHGGLLVVVDDGATVEHFVTPSDRLGPEPSPAPGQPPYTKEHLHYLLRHANVRTLAPAVLETLARMDGAMVLDREAHLLAFGAILRFPIAVDVAAEATEGGRTTAALAASRFGNVLKISEDGVIAFFQHGKCHWEL